MTEIKNQLTGKFQDRSAHIAVIGLGYVGLPLAVTFAEAGFRVTGIDLDAAKTAAINRGESYILDVSSERLARVVREPEAVMGDPGAVIQKPGSRVNPDSRPPASNPQSLSAATDYRVLETCDAVIICVPTPLNKTGDPDISYIVSATEAIARHLHPGMLVVLESTTYPGTTREVLLPILTGAGLGEQGSENIQSPLSGSRAPVPGRDFFLAFSPERVDPGRTDWTIRNTPKVIGGLTPACQEAAEALYAAAVETIVPVSSPEVAETTKLFENTFRSVNIALANELLFMCDKLGLDAWEVLEAAATKPFGFMKFVPGPGLGGHCIPVDPNYLSWKLKTAKYTARFIELASTVNTEMPRYWAQKIQDALNDVGKPVKDSRILVLGVAYKKDVSDLRESPALDIIHLLREKGGDVVYHDPYVPYFCVDGLEMTSIPDLDVALQTADCVVIATDHSTYNWEHIAAQAQLIVDTRHVINV